MLRRLLANSAFNYSQLQHRSRLSPNRFFQISSSFFSSSSPKIKGDPQQSKFETETSKLLNLMSNSLYSDKEVFLRELISNSSDALEKLRFLTAAGNPVTDSHLPLRIDIFVDPEKKTLTIKDNGVGMSKEELKTNLGVIAKSGSSEFGEEKLIGQFGVGFYSSFIVGSRVSVFSRGCSPDSEAHCWQSEGLGDFTIWEAEGVDRGTTVEIELKDVEFCSENKISDVIKKYCNFFSFPIFLNGKQVNMSQPIWQRDPKTVSESDHVAFFQNISPNNSPRFSFQMRTDSPTCINAVLYVPKYKPTLMDISEGEVSLYSRQVMIDNKSSTVLPRWLRFVKGVVDCEDIPLNISREMLQDHALISKIKSTLSAKFVRFLQKKAKEETESYLEFFSDFGIFLREGIVLSSQQNEREEIAKLLRFESSRLASGEKTGLEDYKSRMGNSDTIYYILSPNRLVAESSPYMEIMRKKDVEVLLCTELHDELVLMNLAQFGGVTLKSVESVAQDKKSKLDGSETEFKSLLDWMKTNLGDKVNDVRTTDLLESHPVLLNVPDLGAVRHFLRTSVPDRTMRGKLIQGVLEVNMKHPIMIRLSGLKESDPELALMLLNQLYDNAFVSAGLCDDPKLMVSNINDLIAKLLDKIQN